MSSSSPQKQQQQHPPQQQAVTLPSKLVDWIDSNEELEFVLMRVPGDMDLSQLNGVAIEPTEDSQPIPLPDEVYEIDAQKHHMIAVASSTDDSAGILGQVFPLLPDKAKEGTNPKVLSCRRLNRFSRTISIHKASKSERTKKRRRSAGKSVKKEIVKKQELTKVEE
ncbi:Exportin-1 [Perkinsus chesapeaki]|uniref:Exportin-1 n=1 Tax=Perkinsus chesapeaki TaxID=330153 RepID=A0A7J6MN17_PERCH|nr:Exportin-1 [Perkinsus chesapeaki]|mmetsp:Transcript_8073/g.9007  ORF Transcript_8073/g.9007 Transcript_8073/m.9007 type:complete len:166 (+) Transcript_8073:42-539(+)